MTLQKYVLAYLPVFVFGAVLSLSVIQPALSQSTDAAGTSMTADELEEYIGKQREALEVAQLEREKQIEKRRQIQAALDEKRRKLADVESELEQLCGERKELDPDNNDPCLVSDGS